MPAPLHHTVSIEIVPGIANRLPAPLHYSVSIKIVPGIANFLQADCHIAITFEVIPNEAFFDPLVFSRLSVFFDISPALIVLNPAGLYGLCLYDKLVCDNSIASVNCRCNGIYARILYIIIILVRVVQCCLPVLASASEPVAFLIARLGILLPNILFVIYSVEEIVPVPFPVLHFSQPCITEILVGEVVIQVIHPLIESSCGSYFILRFLHARKIIVNIVLNLDITSSICVIERIGCHHRKPVGIALLYAKGELSFIIFLPEGIHPFGTFLDSHAVCIQCIYNTLIAVGIVLFCSFFS